MSAQPPLFADEHPPSTARPPSSPPPKRTRGRPKPTRSILALDDRPSSFAYPLGTELPPTFVVSTDDLGFRLSAIEAAIRCLAEIIEFAREHLANVAVRTLQLAAETVERQQHGFPSLWLAGHYTNLPDLADDQNEIDHVFGDFKTQP